MTAPEWSATFTIPLKTIDLRFEIRKRNSPVCHRPLGNIPMRSRRAFCGSHHNGEPFGGFGGAKYGKTLDDQAMGPSIPSLMRGPFPALM